MELRNKNILLISPEPWEHIHVSKHHYAIELAKRENKVYFLNPPTKELLLKDTSYENLTVINYQGFLRGLHHLPKVIRAANQKRVLRKIQNLAKVRFDIVWSFDNSVFYDLEIFGSEVFKISHIVDLNQNFQTEKTAKSADICLGVVPKIVERLGLYNSNTHLIRHGVSIHKCTSPVILPGFNKFKVLYFGNMAMPHLDWHLISELAEKFLQIDFIFLGSNIDKLNEQFKKFTNVFFLSPVRSEELVCYMQKADILLLFYKEKYYETYASPHKMMEYLSSGKPIISSYAEDYKEYQDLILMAKSRREWLTQFGNLIRDYSFYGDRNLIYRRKSLAKNNTYAKQIERIQKLIP